ncbi:MAG: outer membrane lipoprotein carrier protein LolA [Acidobacteria bacterium]|nr:outer membrane lipoprotein carrier protein LolA [Acidobacteriota bacterium]
MRSKRWISALVGCLWSLTAFPAVAAETAGPARLETLLRRVQEEQKSVSSLRARFTMLQESELLLEPEESRGEFFFLAPDRVRWEYVEPTAITVVIDGDSMVTWYRDLNRAERAEVGSYSERILKYMNASSSLENLLQSFDARIRFNDGTDQPFEIELSPSYRRIARRMKSMTLWIDRDLYLPVRVRIETAKGEVTEFRFEDLEVNPSIAEQTFAVDLPEGVEVQSSEPVVGSK